MTSAAQTIRKTTHCSTCGLTRRCARVVVVHYAGSALECRRAKWLCAQCRADLRGRWWYAREGE